MLKVLVVDDERLVRMGLKALINEVEGFEVVGQAADGLSAIEEIKLHQPHVVVTDIRMPKMDGEELIRYLDINHPSIRKIVLSGFEDFNYVRGAMKNGAKDYLLKPVDEKELVNLLRRIEADIRAEEAQKIEELNLKIKLNESFPFLKDRFIHDLLCGKPLSMHEIQKKLDYFDLKMDSACYYTMVVSINNYRLICRNEGTEKGKLVSFITRNIAEESIGKHTPFFSCLDGAELGFIVPVSGEKGIPDRILNELYGNLVKYSKASFTLCLGSSADSVMKLSESYDRALCALQHRFYSKGSAVIRYADIEGSPFERIGNDGFYNFNEKYESLFDSCIKTGNSARVKNLLEELCLHLRQSRIYPPEAVKLLTDLHAKLQITFTEFKKAVNEIFGQDYSYGKAIELYDTLEDVENYTGMLYGQVMEKIVSNRGRKDKKLVEIVKEYVDKHYSENITLGTMANITYVNPNYFCEVFKVQTGENFLDYLTRVRIEKAKILLKDMKIKTYEISRMVGYEDSGYFSKVFKKLVGITPSEYRNLNL